MKPREWTVKGGSYAVFDAVNGITGQEPCLHCDGPVPAIGEHVRVREVLSDSITITKDALDAACLHPDVGISQWKLSLLKDKLFGPIEIKEQK
jgi:hypothetical protein